MTKMKARDFVIALLSPMIFGKACIIYFGMNYSQYPGRGYGIGLCISILFTLTMIGRFLWKYRNYQDS
jgi:uncharacterized membrane protein YdjX (TVP38/TMEM64 family)